MIKLKSDQVMGVTLLSKEEYKEYKNYIPFIKDWWWLRSPGPYYYWAAVAYDTKHVVCSGIGVRDNNGVRPALKIENHNLEPGDQFEFGAQEWTVISNNLAICNDIIGKCRFDKVSNNYEKSEIKRYLEGTFLNMEHKTEEI